MASNTVVGSVVYDAVINLAGLRKSISDADKLVASSYDNQKKTAKKASGEITKSSSKDAQARVEEVKKEAEQTIKTISSYTPQIQRQFLTVERANNQVTSATIRAQDAIQRYGSDSAQATKATAALSVAVQNQAQQQSRLQTMLDGSAGGAGRFGDALNKAGAIAGATAAVIGSALDQALSMITNSFSSAISRVDTLKNAPKVLQNLGFSSQESAAAVNKLDKGIRGLPTSLDNAASSLLAIVSASGKSIDYATDLTLAFNNMALAGGKGPAEAQRALTQFTQALGRGKFFVQDFNTLAEVMPAQLNQIAKSLLGAEGNTRTLGTALSNGTLSIEQFNDEVIRLNKEGGDNFSSFRDQASDATKGIRTSLTNMQTAITRGIGKIIDAIGSDNITNAATSMGKAFETALKAVAGVILFIDENSKTFQTLAIIIASLLTPSIIAYTAAITLAGVQSLLAGTRMAAAWLLALGPIGLITAAVVASTALIIANWDSVSTFVERVWHGIQTAARNVIDWVKKNWSSIFAIIAGPISLASAAIIKNFDQIKQAVGNVWSWIRGVFGTIGSVAATIIKIPVNAIIGFAEKTINGFIRAVNGAVNTINKIPGVDIGKLSTINIPKLAEGGIVRARPGGILANIGEGGKDEAVIPLDKLGKMMSSNTNNQNVTVNLSLSGVMTSSKSDERAIATRIAKLINEAVKAKTGSKAIAGI
jgi:tape measure domain-containing protein